MAVLGLDDIVRVIKDIPDKVREYLLSKTISKVVEVKADKYFVYIDEISDGTLRLTFSIKEKEG